MDLERSAKSTLSRPTTFGGKDLMRWITEQDHLQSTSIIAISGAQAFKTVQEAEDWGAFTFLLKPRDYNGWIDLVYQLEDFLQTI